jgi:membrane fusion protein, multidrug efflux system
VPAAGSLKASLAARRQPLLVGGLAAACALMAGGWLLSEWGVESTDNAQLQAHLVEIASRVPGTITAVPVQDDQPVQAGALLVQLDPRDARTRLAQAQADLLEARQQARAMESQAGSTASDAAAAADQAAGDQLMARAELDRAGVDLQRLEFLLRQGGVSRQEVDRARATYRQAQGQLSRSQASALQATASARKVGVDQQKAAAAMARIRQADAALQEAQLQLGYTRILAPSAGRIGSRSAEPGRQVQPGQPLMTLVAPRPWVEAHFKETQLQALRPGQPAEVRIDAFPDQSLRGHVLSVAPASGARFALLPPDNATGNFTKVVQRVTARIALDQVPPALAPRLVPGLSATVRVRRR